jgi:ketosteroid isomerase-like protein
MDDQIPADLQILEEEWDRAIVSNDATAIGRFVADDWVIIGPEGQVIDQVRFLSVIESGALKHESMKSEEVRVRVYGDTAILTARTKSKGEFAGQAFATDERSTSVYSKIEGRWQCVLTQLTPIRPA